MDAVLLIEGAVGGDAVEEERVEDRTVSGGKIAVDRVETGAIVRAEVRRRQHAGEQHRQAALAEPGEQTIEAVAGDCGIDAAERVVGAELDDHGVGVVAHRPVDPRQAVAGGVAGDSGVDDRDVMAAGAEGGFEPGGERLANWKAKARRQAVAEDDDADRVGRGRQSSSDQRGSERESQEEGLDRHCLSTI